MIRANRGDFAIPKVGSSSAPTIVVVLSMCSAKLNTDAPRPIFPGTFGNVGGAVPAFKESPLIYECAGRLQGREAEGMRNMGDEQIKSSLNLPKQRFRAARIL